MMKASTSFFAVLALLATSTYAFSPTLVSPISAISTRCGTKLHSSYLDSLSSSSSNNVNSPTSPTPVAASPAVITPPATVPIATVSQAATAAPVSSGGASATSAISSMATSQSSVLSKIAASIPDLQPHPSSYDASSGLTVNGRTATLDARDAPGPANIAWISSLCVDDTLSSLTIFNGPLSDVPHLISRCAIRDEMMHFFLDFRPRAYGAYDLRNPDGSYPGPETLGRKSFEYSGARKDFDGKFGTEEVVQFLDGFMSQLEGAVRLNEDATALGELEKVTRGPLALELLVPLSQNNVDAIISAREIAANYWLTWALDPSHGHRPGAPVNSQYVYDSKYKINAYGALLDVYSDLYGQTDGAMLAAADSGPLDEAYVGGGS